MKYTIITALIVSLFTASTSFAQGFEGKINFKSEAINLPAEMESMKAMISSDVTMYISEKKVRSEMKNAMTGTIIMLIDMIKNESVMCIDMMGNKSAVVTSIDEYKKNQEKGPKPEYRVSKTGETKMVAGYKCEKAVAVVVEDGKEIETEIWFTREIQNSNVEMAEIPGMPLEYSIKADQFTIHMVATEVTKQKVDSKLFEIPDGYTKKTMAEFQQQYAPGKH